MRIFPKLLIAFACAALVPLGGSFGLIQYRLSTRVRQEAIDHLKSLAALQADRLHELRHEELAKLRLLSSRTQLRVSLRDYLRTQNPEAVTRMVRILEDAREAVSSIERIEVVTLEHDVVAAVGDLIALSAPLYRDGDALDFRIDREGRSHSIATARLVLDSELLGWMKVYGTVELTAAAVAEATGFGQTGETLLVHESGKLLLPTRFSPRFSNTEDIIIDPSLLQHGLIQGVRDRRGHRVIAVTNPIPSSPWIVVVKMDQDEVLAPGQELRSDFLLGGGVGLIVLLGLAWFFARSFARPLQSLSATALAIREGSLDARAHDEVRRDEFGELARTFNAMAEEITKNHRELESRVRQRTAALERSNRDLEQFAYVASHDLQTPIRNINTAVTLFRRNIDESQLGEDPKRYLEQMKRAADLMAAQIQGLLAFSRVDTQGGDMSRPVDLDSLLTSIQGQLRGLIEENQAVIEVEALPTVQGDRLQLGIVFQNLISNAIKYRDQDRAPHIRVTGTTTEVGHEIRVADNGVGIEPKYRDRVFKMFQRLHHQYEVPGTGIGLAICSRIIERHGGSIWNESPPEGEPGTVFAFRLPLDPSSNPDPEEL